MTQTIEQLQAKIAELEEENARLRTVPMKYRRMAFNAQLQDENNELRAQLASSEQQVGEWQPIETAPKTGRTILLGYTNSLGNWRTMRGQWFSREVIDEEWEEPDDCNEGWYETSVEADDIPSCWATNPTHWMPLPTPPKRSIEGV